MKRFIKSSGALASPPRDIDVSKLDIVDYWDDNGDVYFTVDIGDDYLVDVKYPRLGTKYSNICEAQFALNFSYVINCDETGSEIYNREYFGQFRPLHQSEQDDIIEFVDNNAAAYVCQLQ